MENLIKVLIVDDSSLVRQALKELLSSEEDIEVVATAQDPYVAAEKLKKIIPDVIILDIEMPRMDGITFLKKIMQQHPIPVVICSTLVKEGSHEIISALESGAVDIIKKPSIGTQRFFEESKVLVTDTIRAAASIKPSKKPLIRKRREKLTADAMIDKPSLKNRSMNETTDKVIVMGSSTGGTEAVSYILQNMPLGCPGIVIVQHMPEGFTHSFAERLNSLCNINVAEAVHGQSIIKGQALIAPGGKHLLLKRSGARYLVHIKDGPLVSRHRPSVDVLFRSAAKYAGKNATGVILTGMGDDGARGMLELKEAGARTIGQDEATSVVYGMPREAFERGAVEKQLALENIPAALVG